MSWASTHRRNAVVKAVLADVGRRGPGAVEAWLPRLEAEFDDFGQFLQHAQRRWNTHWAARMDLLIERGQAQDAKAVQGQWRRLARALPGTRELLDAYAAHPALRRGDQTYGPRSAESDVPASRARLGGIVALWRPRRLCARAVWRCRVSPSG